MRDNRDMFYSNYQSGGYMDPNMMPMQMPQAQGYNMNASYQAYGPNVIPNNNTHNNIPTIQNNNYIDEYEERITKLERSIRRLDQRLRKLENANTISGTEEINIDNNLYMI